MHRRDPERRKTRGAKRKSRSVSTTTFFLAAPQNPPALRAPRCRQYQKKKYGCQQTERLSKKICSRCRAPATPEKTPAGACVNDCAARGKAAPQQRRSPDPHRFAARHLFPKAPLYALATLAVRGATRAPLIGILSLPLKRQDPSHQQNLKIPGYKHQGQPEIASHNPSSASLQHEIPPFPTKPQKPGKRNG